MTSEERRAVRYRRRKERRAEKKARYAASDCFDRVFSFEHLYQSYKLCRRGVAWKGSVQKYITQAPLNVAQTFDLLQTGKFRARGFFEFDIIERGKKRHIRSVTISERVVQRCLCDYALVPILGRTFIFDNGASMQGKGYTFAADRLTKHLRAHYKKYGADGYVLQFDFSKFFDRVSHKLVKGILRKEFTDKRIIALTEHFIDAFGDIGMGLGSQISQILALASANRLDHYIKEVCRIKGYGRYMDDGYLIHPDKTYLRQCLTGIRRICSELEITLNERKTQISKLSRGFVFLKIRYCLQPSGKIVQRICRKSVTKERRKLKALRKKVAAHVMTWRDVYQSFQSWRAYVRRNNAWHAIQSIEQLYDDLFLKPWLVSGDFAPG